MADRWKECYLGGLALCRRVDRALAQMDHPDQGAFASLTNALEFQFEQGADTETVRHLLCALHAFARSAGIPPAALGLARNAEADLDRLAPEPKGPRRRSKR